MKASFLVLMILGLSSFANAEVYDLNAYKSKFRLPADAKNVQVQYLLPGKVTTMREVTPISGCSETVDGGPNECVDIKDTVEKALQAQVTYESQAASWEIQDGSEYNDLVANFRLTDFSADQLAKLPKVNFFGKGSKANRLYARGVLKVVVTNETVIEWHTDYDKSEFCPTDGEGSKLDPSCEDKIVTKPVEVAARFVEITVVK